MPRKQPKKTTTRGRGRPKAGQAPIRPEDHAELAEMWLTGHGYTEMAGRFGVHTSTIEHHINQTVRPAFKTDLAERLGEEIAKVEVLERVAWKCFRASQEPESRRQVKRQLAEAAKDAGADMQIVEMVSHEITRTGNAAYLQVIQWCREWFAKVGGWYQARDEGPAGTRVEVLPVVLIEVTTQEQAQQVLGFEEWQRRSMKVREN